MSDPKDIPNESGPKDGMSEDHWRNYFEEHTAPNKNPGVNEGQDIGLGEIENAPTISKGEAMQSGENRIKGIIEKGKQVESKLLKKETPTQKYTEKHPSKKGLSNPEKINEPTETHTPEPIEPTPSNTETSNVNDPANLNKLQEPQKAGEERPSKLQGFIEDAKTIVKDYVVPVAKTGGGIVTGAKILFDPSDTVDEATEQQAIKDWAEKNQTEKNVNTPSEKSVKEDNDFDNAQNQGIKEENSDTAKEEPQPQNQLERLSQVGYPQDEVADQSNSMPQTITENDNIQLALNDLSSQPSIDDNTSSVEEISKEDFYLMTKTDVSDQPYKTDEFENDDDRNRFLSMMNNLDTPNPNYDNNPEVEEKEAFLSEMNNLDSNDNNSEVANSGNELGQEEKENFLLAMNDLDSPSKRDDIGSFYWETEVYESKLERGEIDEDGTPDVGGMDGGDD